MGGKLEGSYSDFTVAEVKTKFMKLLADTEDWLYGEGEEATKSVYVAKLDELKKVGDPIAKRYKDADERPSAIENFRKTSREWEDVAASTEAKYEHISKEDREKVVKECQNKITWLEGMIKQQDAAPKHADPVLTVDKLNKEREALIYAVFPIMNKAKPAPPKAEKKPEEKKEAQANGTHENANGDAGTAMDEDKEPQEKKHKDDSQNMDVD